MGSPIKLCVGYGLTEVIRVMTALVSSEAMSCLQLRDQRHMDRIKSASASVVS